MDIDTTDKNFVLEDFVPYLLNRIVNRLNSELKDALNAMKLTVTHWRVIAVLTARSPMTVSELVTLTVTEQSSLSRSLMQLETKGLVERVTNAEDARQVEVHLTPAGQAAFAKLWPLACGIADHALDGLSREEHDAFVETLHRILDNIRRSPEG